jgi:hypothetical protein
MELTYELYVRRTMGLCYMVRFPKVNGGRAPSPMERDLRRPVQPSISPIEEETHA